MPRETEGHIEGQKDGQALFYSTLSATISGPASTTAAEWHLQVKDTEYDIGLTKNYCITSSIKKTRSIHKLILKIQQILGLMN